MEILKSNLKLIVQILFVIIFFHTLHAKNLDKFDEGEQISDYFSGSLLLSDNQYSKSYKLFKKLDGLEERHTSYSQKYLHSLVNLGKFNEAFNYSKKLERKQLNNFESDLIIGVYYLVNKKNDLAQKYFLKIKKRKTNLPLNIFISNSLLNWSSFHKLDQDKAQIRINSLDPRFGNLIEIQNAFLHCHYQSKKTEFFFQKLTSKEKVDFSRYKYFYASYLVSENKIDEAKKIVKSSLELNPRNLLLNQFKIDLDQQTFKTKNNFSCSNAAHIAAEILYISANALSSQSIYTFSNFYLNLAKYLNKNFYSFNTLLAENFYKVNNYSKAIKVNNEISKEGSVFSWYAAKQNARILIKENKKQRAIKLVTESYKNLSNKSIYDLFDYAEFLKNNELFEESLNFYTQIIQSTNKDHPLYAEARDGRGVAYERLGNWNEAEKDLLSSLKANPDQAYVINYLAYSWIEKGINIKQSLQMLRKANNLKSNDAFIIDSLGWALFKLKKYKESKNYLQLAVKLMPGDPVVSDHFGDALWMNGDKIQARYYWKYALNLENSKKELKDNIKDKLILGL